MTEKSIATTSAADESAAITLVMEQIRAARSQHTGGVINWLTTKAADYAADATTGFARIGAGAMAGVENASLAYHSERDRQLERSARALLARARG